MVNERLRDSESSLLALSAGPTCGTMRKKHVGVALRMVLAGAAGSAWGTRKGGGEREGGRTGRIEDRGEQFRNLGVQKSGLPCFSAMAEVGKARNGVGRTNE
jgi:hypothetical protein